MNSGLTKQINILDYALSSLGRRWIKNLSVFVVFAGVIFLVASFQLVTRALTETAELALERTPEITVQNMTAGRQVEIPVDYGLRLSSIFGIREVIPRVWGYYFDEVQGANYTVMGIEQRMPMLEDLDLTLEKGGTYTPGSPGKALIGQSVKRLLDRKGSRLLSLFRPDLSQISFEIAGVFKRETDILTDDLIVLNIDDARELFAIPQTMATDLCVYVTNENEIATIARKIADTLPGTRVLTKTQIGRTYQVVFGWRSGFASVCLLAALSAFVIFSWDKASGLSLEEKKEISVLKILGWETRDILAVRFWEGFLVSGLAFVVGCSIAYTHVVFFDASLFRPVLVGWSVIYPEFRLVPSFQVGDFILVFCLSVLPYLAATVIPSWRSASVPSDSALSGM